MLLAEHARAPAVPKRRGSLTRELTSFYSADTFARCVAWRVRKRSRRGCETDEIPHGRGFAAKRAVFSNKVDDALSKLAREVDACVHDPSCGRTMHGRSMHRDALRRKTTLKRRLHGVHQQRSIVTLDGSEQHCRALAVPMACDARKHGVVSARVLVTAVCVYDGSRHLNP
eukprot:1332888-Rhodomonas_salina.2